MDQLLEDQLTDLHGCFKIFDQDGDGRITKEELRIAMRSLGQNPTESELDEAIKEVDANGSGTIELNEFIEMMTKRFDEVDEEAELRESFKIFDKDGDGYISMEELVVIMTKLHIGETMTKEEIQGMLNEVDTNGDGLIDYNEFVKMMTCKL